MGQGEKELLVYVNGSLVPESQATISVWDSAFNYGDAVHEGIRVYNRRVFQLRKHLDRLYDSCHSVGITMSMTKDSFEKEIISWLRANKIEHDFHFRSVVTRGIRKPCRLDPRTVIKGPNIVFLGTQSSSYLFEPLKVITSSVRKIPPDCLDSKIKSNNYLNVILARMEAIQSGVDDAIQLDTQGFISEITSMNPFIVKRDSESKPTISTSRPIGCLDGITRRTIIKLARERGYQPLERDISLSEVYNADEFMGVGTAAEIKSIVEADGRRIGNGEPGPFTKEIFNAWKELTETDGTSIY